MLTLGQSNVGGAAGVSGAGAVSFRLSIAMALAPRTRQCNKSESRENIMFDMKKADLGEK